jgi:hypothetical protein
MTQEQIKDQVAKEKGYPNWKEFFDWTCRNGQFPVVVAQLIEAAMQEVCDRLVSSPAATVRGAEENLTGEVMGPLSVSQDVEVRRLADGRLKIEFLYLPLKGSTIIIRGIASQSGYTLAQVSDAWDAAVEHTKYGDWRPIEGNPPPDKITFLNSIKTPEIK